MKHKSDPAISELQGMQEERDSSVEFQTQGYEKKINP